VREVERIKHGLTNESWLVSTDQDVLVVRMSNTSEESLQINRASEALILGAVADAGIGPEVLLCDPARHLLVTSYMGPTWSEADAAFGDNIVRIAAVLRRLHALAPPQGLHSVDLLAVIDGYLQTLDENSVHCAATVSAMRIRSREIASMLQRDSVARLCHNDVHALNIVATQDGLRLIDWEYAGLGERMFDLASICIYHGYDKAQRERLLLAYTAVSDRIGMHRLELACWLFEYIRDLWTAVRELPAVISSLPSAEPRHPPPP
jgi:thiamine kinase